MPDALVPTRPSPPRIQPLFRRSDLKYYPHFDAPVSAKEAERMVTDPARVGSHKFFPFLLFHERYQPFRVSNPIKPTQKERPIRYAARRDAYIFSYYRRILSERYERELEHLGLEHCPIAYRKIRQSASDGRGKCNIDFAYDAFQEILQHSNCIAIALDIRSYFESLDHAHIKKRWCELLGTTSLPDDHYAVFKNITKYAFVDQREVYRRLGYFGPDPEKPGVDRFLVPFELMPRQLCSPADFREKIAGGNPNLPSIVQKNQCHYGIPQGAPISDLIANFYLLEFDRDMNNYARSRKGRYMRYSDDILMILPQNNPDYLEALNYASDLISKFGDSLTIKREKTAAVHFVRSGNNMLFEHCGGPQGKNGLEYLGFRFDGRDVFVRDSTISRLHRKIAVASRGAAIAHAARNPGLAVDELIERFNFGRFFERFSRVSYEKYSDDDYKSWTFWTYLKRSTEKFERRGTKMFMQVAGMKRTMRERVAREIMRAAGRN